MDFEARMYEVLAAGVAQRTFPGAVVGYIKDDTERVLPFGRLTYDDDSPVVTADTVYDLASVTKSVPTASVILWLIEHGKLSLDDPVEKYVPEMARTSGARILIRHLLTFTAVFNQKGHLSETATKGREAVLQAIFTSPLRFPPGEHYYYSDALYILLGMVAEQAAGKPLDRLADDLFFAPLGMLNSTFHPETLAGAAIAPTEVTEHGVVQGEANDEKARVFAREGAVAGHAGLFSTAGDLLRFCRMLLNSGELEGHRYFTPDTIWQMRKQIVEDGAYGVSLAWRTRHPGLIRPSLTGRIFGKEGFTGTMILLDPDRQQCVVLLSNRTYPKRQESTDAIKKVRFALEDIFFA